MVLMFLSQIFWSLDEGKHCSMSISVCISSFVNAMTLFVIHLPTGILSVLLISLYRKDAKFCYFLISFQFIFNCFHDSSDTQKRSSAWMTGYITHDYIISISETSTQACLTPQPMSLNNLLNRIHESEYKPY